jgi:hypothetical protein
MRIVLVGSIGRFPVAGHAWINLQYMLGFQALGHEVYYLEDCGQESYVYDWQRQEMRQDLDYPADFIRRALGPHGFDGRWIYRAGEHSAGMTITAMADICQSADLLMIRGAPLPHWRDEYRQARRRAYLDVDPMFTQVKALREDSSLRKTIDGCQVLFTIAQRIGAPDCAIPDLGRSWQRTVSPVYLPEWPVASPSAPAALSTIMQWSAYRAVSWEGVEYGNKQNEFPRFADVARVTAPPFCVAMTGRPPEHVDTSGWQIIDGMSVSSTLEEYRHFIQSSLGEFAVAKHGYVASRGGWFSDRSVCYLASGRPVVVQDTGLETWLPVGDGLLTFQTPEDAVTAVADVQARYAWHCRMARQLAEEYFATDIVLPRLLDAIDL